MHWMQKAAWYNLCVSLLSAAVFLVLFIQQGPHAAQNAIAILVLMVFSFFSSGKRKKGKEMIRDERDREITLKEMLTGMSVFFFYSIVALILIPEHFGPEQIPVDVFKASVFFGVILAIAARSVATIILYRAYSPASGRFLDSFRYLTELQRMALLALPILLIISFGIVIDFPIGDPRMPETLPGLLLLAFIGFLLWKRKQWLSETIESEKQIYRRAEKIALFGFAVSLALSAAVLTVVGTDWLTVIDFCYLGVSSLIVGILTLSLMIIVLSIRQEQSDAGGLKQANG